ncbi:MAG: hypothetical protein U0934_21230 [Pseudotabrizicola sp.]|uniref:hypothetical protein n=1 Tax=Pseudotabrizicola sp. TaxID=2939647 RepID=UPI00271C4378|nr:hypothetical protein [Pseudotabrizicola sp.]MDO8882423.1 hypothetical protein [Pseudotabrizicola sp.]MDP2082050.1 hypothetical protein [Pseudotabrizicola sp.]MDZ7576443.1 hypothetical protein [Pseudotabrizicola sp.]
MDSDLMFVIGATLLVLCIPSIFAAFADSRPPRAAAIILLIGGTLVAIALSQKPGGIALSQIPDIFFRVIGRFVN